jgi:hypothetical protein
MDTSLSKINVHEYCLVLRIASSTNANRSVPSRNHRLAVVHGVGQRHEPLAGDHPRGLRGGPEGDARDEDHGTLLVVHDDLVKLERHARLVRGENQVDGGVLQRVDFRGARAHGARGALRPRRAERRGGARDGSADGVRRHQ